MSKFTNNKAIQELLKLPVVGQVAAVVVGSLLGLSVLYGLFKGIKSLVKKLFNREPKIESISKAEGGNPRVEIEIPRVEGGDPVVRGENPRAGGENPVAEGESPKIRRIKSSGDIENAENSGIKGIDGIIREVRRKSSNSDISLGV